MIPAEIQTYIHPAEAQSIDTPFAADCTIDGEGLLNHFSVEPDMYPSEYPLLRQQRYYDVLEATDVLLVVMLMRVAL